MLKITKAQMKMFDGLMLEQFKMKLHIDLRELFPDETKHMNEKTLGAVIVRGIDKGS